MVSIPKNLAVWNSADHWERGTLGPGGGLEDGEKWSRAWGNSLVQWQVTILPRIRGSLPAESVLEVGAGHGRWSQYLRPLCKRLHLQDLAPTCIDYCRQRFAQWDGITYSVTDGMSFPGVDDESVDFIFSFDSLVHADKKVMEAYLKESARVLRTGGTAFLHHSNLLKAKAKNGHMRDPGVSADLVRGFCTKAGLRCVSQEQIPWTAEHAEEKAFTDCFTAIEKCPGSSPGSSPVPPEGPTYKNPLLIQEQRVSRAIFDMYIPKSKPADRA